jgi:hypothetical protein
MLSFLLNNSAYTVDDLGNTVGNLIFFCLDILFLYYKRMMSNEHASNKVSTCLACAYNIELRLSMRFNYQDHAEHTVLKILSACLACTENH